MSIRTLAILGSTGSIGTQALEVAARHDASLTVTGLAAGSSLDVLCEQARRVKPVALALESAPDEVLARQTLAQAAHGAEVWVGPGSAAKMAAAIDADVVLNGIVGAAGLRASLATLERGARLALANKETLVIGGPLIERALETDGAELVPVDSEHSAALQCLAGVAPAGVAKLTLTASGGALRNHPDWAAATRDEVLAHPVWAMGPRITVDSALLFNKGLELIEARWLFDLGWDQLDAVIHPEAIVHAMVTFTDGSTVLQAAPADMALPIQLALSWPDRWDAVVAASPLADLRGLSFAPLQAGRYPAFDLACRAGRQGGTAPCALNAADEVAVKAYLDGAITLGQVPEILERVFDAQEVDDVMSVDQLEQVDAWARETARAQVVRA